MKNDGFTLIELLITISLLGIVATITTQVFILGFRSQAKSEIMKEIKQNGDYVMSVMESMISNASDIPLSCNASSDELTIVNPDGLRTTFICDEDAHQIASQSGLSTLSLTSTKVTVDDCSGAFRVVCPDPPLSPKYVFINFTLSQLASGGTPENRASMEYQSTISLRNYQ